MNPAGLKRSKDETSWCSTQCKEAGGPSHNTDCPVLTGAPTLRGLQTLLPWALGYSKAFAATREAAGPGCCDDGSDMTHLDFQHALMHVVKATGKLAAMVENADHNRRESSEACASCHAERPSMTACKHKPGYVTRKREGLTDFPIHEVDKYLADLVICAMRMANTRPGGAVDLQRAVIHRLESKNDVKLNFVD